MFWLDYLKNANAEPIGLALICKCPAGADLAKRQLYSARAKAREQGDKTLDSLSISMSPHSDEILFIYKREDKDNDSPESTGAGSETSNPSTI